jgi:hypothetical protein
MHTFHFKEKKFSLSSSNFRASARAVENQQFTKAAQRRKKETAGKSSLSLATAIKFA